jgi:tRNA-2-methylthio-N6-dimethylallyladenosine synthase
MIVQISGVNKKGSKGELKRRKLYIKTFGCQMNEYDSEKLITILQDRYDSVPTPAEADLVLINTCSVREKPEHKLYSLIGEIKELKAQRPELLVGVGGCVAQQEGENIVKRSPGGVDFVFGTHNLSLVPSLIQSRQETGKPQVAVNYREDWEELPLGLAGGSRVSTFVSISRGCNKNCAYCIVPVTRGKEVSRAILEIEKEVKIAAHRGAREIVLLGQTVNSYGLDFRPRVKFVELLERVSQVKGIERIRFTSPHPQEVRQDFIDAVTSNPKICRHIHMPLQSGSDRILKAMNRNYRRDKYLRIIENLKSRVPDMGVTTDIIVGFPGETDSDFEETLEIMKRVRFDSSYSFMYSSRPGTPAALMEADPALAVPADQKLARLKRLQKLQDEITHERLQSFVGQTVEVLIDAPSTSHGDRLAGRNSQNILVNLDQRHEALEPGMFITARINGAARFTLKGELLEILGK